MQARDGHITDGRSQHRRLSQDSNESSCVLGTDESRPSASRSGSVDDDRPKPKTQTSRRTPSSTAVLGAIRPLSTEDLRRMSLPTEPPDHAAFHKRRLSVMSACREQRHLDLIEQGIIERDNRKVWSPRSWRHTTPQKDTFFHWRAREGCFVM